MVAKLVYRPLSQKDIEDASVESIEIGNEILPCTKEVGVIKEKQKANLLMLL